VVVATHGRAPLLTRLVDALERQESAPSFEVILVDDGSPDDTWSTIERLEQTARVTVRGVRLARQSGPAAARNAGWRATSSPRIVFTDDDCVPQPGWLRTLADGLEEADIAQGVTRPDPAQRHLLGAFSRTMEVTSETGYYQTCNVAYRRAVLERVGGFDDDLRQAGEDIELATRALASGARTSFHEDALVHHDVRPSNLVQHLRGTRRWAGIVLAVRKQPVLRERLYHGFLWKRSHAPALLAGLGLIVAAGGKGGLRIAGAAAVAPYVRHRLRVEPLRNIGPRRRVALLPAALVADLDEVVLLAASSVRYRTLVL
jgi:glycosyltransferase involved in cell wall biosynthesis